MASADPALMRAINQFQVMDAIRRHGPISRVEIVDRTDLSPTTVSAITSSLLGDNVIMPASADIEVVADTGSPIVPRRYEVEGSQPRGRPRKMLALNPGAACVVGVKLTPDQITVAVTDFRADVLNTLTLPVNASGQPVSAICKIIESAIGQCVFDAELQMSDIRGVSIGLPGVIERTSGICRQSSLFSEADVPLAEALEEQLSIKVTLDTDANLITLAESWFGQAKGMDDFMVISVEQSLGLGIMHQGELFRGANGQCPDLNDLMIPADNGVGSQKLSEIASLSSMLESVGIWGKNAPDAQIPNIEDAMNRLVDMAQSGDEQALQTLSTAGRGLGAAIANLIMLFAPSRVIVTGRGAIAGDYLLSSLQETAFANSHLSSGTKASITMQEWNDDTWARGAAAMTLRDLYGMPWEAMAPVMRI